MSIVLSKGIWIDVLALSSWVHWWNLREAKYLEYKAKYGKNWFRMSPQLSCRIGSIQLIQEKMKMAWFLLDAGWTKEAQEIYSECFKFIESTSKLSLVVNISLKTSFGLRLVHMHILLLINSCFCLLSIGHDEFPTYQHSWWDCS